MRFQQAGRRHSCTSHMEANASVTSPGEILRKTPGLGDPISTMAPSSGAVAIKM